MFYRDHSPPHYHAKYGEYEALLGIDPIVLLEGSLPSRASSLVFEWAAIHQTELRENWHLARENMPLNKISPLE